MDEVGTPPEHKAARVVEKIKADAESMLKRVAALEAQAAALAKVEGTNQLASVWKTKAHLHRTSDQSPSNDGSSGGRARDPKAWSRWEEPNFSPQLVTTIAKRAATIAERTDPVVEARLMLPPVLHRDQSLSPPPLSPRAELASSSVSPFSVPPYRGARYAHRTRRAPLSSATDRELFSQTMYY
mmetsp:Transcript_23853/g.56663  ORF Transcript_23853/g.56663 Transcript_23853/m.56663 type:complete len:184 (+) Transcript_23853:363-914(+)